jgi:RHS repeat-associated protein
MSKPLLDTSGHVAAVQEVKIAHDDVTHPDDTTSITDPEGGLTHFSYDGHGAPVSVVDPEGNRTTFEYNDIGWLMGVVSPRGNLPNAQASKYRTRYDRNAFGQTTVTRDPLFAFPAAPSHSLSRKYSDGGLLISQTDGRGNMTRYVYDAAGEMLDVTRADGSHVRNEYWPDGSIRAQVDAAARRTSYEYDALGHLTTSTDPLGRATTYAYDALEHVLQRSDPNGAVTRYTYDPAGQVSSVHYSDGSTPNVTDITYDADGQRTAMTDGTGTSHWDWDSLNRLVSSTAGAGTKVAYNYNLVGETTSISYPHRGKVTRSYDHAGRLTRVTDWVGNTTIFDHDADSNLITARSTNVLSSYEFDPAEQLTKVIHRGPHGTIMSFNYKVDGNGQVGAVDTTGVTEGDRTIGYDSLNRMVKVNKRTLAFDAADNLRRLADGRTQAFDPANQLCWSATESKPTEAKPSDPDLCTSIPEHATVYSYDQNGNRTAAKSPDSTVSMVYDQNNRLVGYTRQQVSEHEDHTRDLTQAVYRYNGDGLRTSKAVDGTTHNFVWDVASALPQLIADGGISYIYGDTGSPIESIDEEGKVSFYLHDALDSVRGIVSSDGGLIGAFTYDEYGRPLPEEHETTSPFGFAGEYRDQESGFIYLRARLYDPVSAQFLSRDPAATLTRSPYAYALQDPVNRSDPTGLFGTWGLTGTSSSCDTPPQDPNVPVNAGDEWCNKILPDVKDKLNNLWQACQDFWNNDIVKTVRDIITWLAPQTKIAKVLKWLGRLINAIKILDWIGDRWQQITGVLHTVAGVVTTVGGAIWSGGTGAAGWVARHLSCLNFTLALSGCSWPGGGLSPAGGNNNGSGTPSSTDRNCAWWNIFCGPAFIA